MTHKTESPKGAPATAPAATPTATGNLHDWQARYGLQLEIAKIVAVFLAGIWALFLYYKIQRNFSDPQTPTLESTAVLEASPAGPGDRQTMVFRVRHKNLGKVDVRITHSVIRLFYGKIDKSPSDSVFEVNNPPPLGEIIDTSDEEPVTWTPISYKACITPSIVTNGETAVIPSDLNGYVFRTGGVCGTGVIRANTSMEQNFDLRYMPDAAYVGVAAAFVFDNGTTGDDPRVTYVTAHAEAVPAAQDSHPRGDQSNK
jgi:hypothetical protein